VIKRDTEPSIAKPLLRAPGCTEWNRFAGYQGMTLVVPNRA